MPESYRIWKTDSEQGRFYHMHHETLFDKLRRVHNKFIIGLCRNLTE